MLKRLIKESFELWCKKRWLKLMDKEVRKRDKHYQKYKRHDYIAKRLMNDFNNQFEKGSDNNAE